jgi:hypothetical protein
MRAIAWIVFLSFIAVSAAANYLHGEDALAGFLMAVVPIGFAAVIFLVESLVSRRKGGKALYFAAGVVGAGAGVASYVGLATMAIDHNIHPVVSYLLPLAYDGVVAVASLAIRGLAPDHEPVQTGPDHVDHEPVQTVDHPRSTAVDQADRTTWTTPVDHPVQTVVRAVDQTPVQTVDQPWSAGQSPVHPVDQAVDHDVDQAVDQAVDHPVQVDRTTVDHEGGPAVDQTVDHSVDQVDQTNVVQWTDRTEKDQADRMTEAVRLVLTRELNPTAAAKRTGVPKSTLTRKVKAAQTPTETKKVKAEPKAIEAPKDGIDEALQGVDMDAELAKLLGDDEK